MSAIKKSSLQSKTVKNSMKTQRILPGGKKLILKFGSPRTSKAETVEEPEQIKENCSDATSEAVSVVEPEECKPRVKSEEKKKKGASKKAPLMQKTIKMVAQMRHMKR